MRRHIINFILLIPFITLLTGCEEMVSEVDIEPAPSKLVITSFINPDMPNASVRVSKSRPLYTPTSYDEYSDFHSVDDAFVTLTNFVDSVVLSYDIETKTYIINRERFPIIKGTTYLLTVVTSDGDSASATTTVPALTAPAIELISIDSTIEYEQRMYYANVKFKDIEGIGQYYSFNVGAVYWIEGQSTPSLSEIGFQRGDPYVTDKNKDGNYFSYSTNNFVKYGTGPSRLYFTLAVTDEHYYNYHKGLQNYDEGNPFAEPVPVYSNVKGGLGVFCSYVQTGMAFDL